MYTLQQSFSRMLQKVPAVDAEGLTVRVLIARENERRLGHVLIRTWTSCRDALFLAVRLVDGDFGLVQLVGFLCCEGISIGLP